jgi:site-specific DNA recombinase
MLFGAVISYRVDRLGRSLRALLDAYYTLDGMGIVIKSATEPFDTSTPIGKFLFQLLGPLAELEKETITERMAMGRSRVARAGKWPTGVVPTGYDLDESGRLTPSSRMVPGAGMTEADLVREIYRRVAEDGDSAVNTTRWLNSLGITPTRRYAGGILAQKYVAQQWTVSRVNLMLKNPIYRGEHVFKAKSGPITRIVPSLVDGQTWEKVQAQLRKNKVLSTRNAKHVYLLRRLVRCGLCGGGYTGTLSGNKGGKWTNYYYRCVSQFPSVAPDVSKRCIGKQLPAPWLEDLAWQDIKAFVHNPEPYL